MDKEIWYKVINKLHQKTHKRRSGDKPIFMLYPSYWHSFFFSTKQPDRSAFYLAARPNPGAGIGHQMANWIAGRWYAEYFGLGFAHIPFSSSWIPNSTNKWEEFLGFGSGERNAYELMKVGYRKVLLPKFKEVPEEITVIKKIIDSYSGKKILFVCEQDQFYRDQIGVIEEIQKKFYSAPSRKNDHLIYSSDDFNIAIHVRRGDIVQKNGENNPNLSMRYQGNEYFINALNTALDYIGEEKNVKIYLFSQGKPEDFKEFEQFDNVHFCLDMNAQDSFLHMVYADVLVTSKSSFSYKPALLNKGIKFCPMNFWHGYPDNEKWILLDDNGKKLKESING